MSIAAYPLQSSIPSYADFELRGGQNNGSAFVLRGQSNGAPTILRPRVTPIQEASMSVAINATINTQFNNASPGGWEGIAPTVELLKITNSGLQPIWTNQLFGQQRRDLWIAKQRDWHQLTWIQDIPQLGGDLLNIGLVNKCPSGYAKLGNLSLTNHYSRYYESVTGGSSANLSLTRKTVTRSAYYVAGVLVHPLPDYWYESYLDTLIIGIKKGESVTQNAIGTIGCISDSDSDVPIRLGITIKYTGLNGQQVFKDVVDFESETPVIEDRLFMASTNWVAEQDYIMAEPVLYLKTRYGRIHGSTASHNGIKVDISSTRNLLGSA